MDRETYTKKRDSILERMNHEELLEASKLTYLVAEGIYSPEELEALTPGELESLASNITDEEILEEIRRHHEEKQKKTQN